MRSDTNNLTLVIIIVWVIYGRPNILIRGVDPIQYNLKLNRGFEIWVDNHHVHCRRKYVCNYSYQTFSDIHSTRSCIQRHWLRLTYHSTMQNGICLKWINVRWIKVHCKNNWFKPEPKCWCFPASCIMTLNTKYCTCYVFSL